MKTIKQMVVCLGLTMVVMYACKHEPIPAPLHVTDTLKLNKHIYIFKDTLTYGGWHHTPIYGSSGDTIKDSICFSEEVQPLVVSHCAKTGCHDAITAA